MAEDNKCDCGGDEKKDRTLLYTTLGFGALLVITYVSMKFIFKKNTNVSPQTI